MISKIVGDVHLYKQKKTDTKALEEESSSSKLIHNKIDIKSQIILIIDIEAT